MLIVDPESGAIVDANRSAENFYGYSRHQLQQMTIDQINVLSREKVEQEFRRAALEQRNYFLFEHQLADGSIRTVEVYSSPVTVDSRTLLFSIIHDVGQELSFQQAVAESEVRLRFAERVADMGHWTLDLKTGIYSFSEGAMDLLEIEGSRMPVEDLLALVVEEDRQKMLDLRQALIAGKKQYRIDIRFQRPQGNLIDLRSEGVYDASSQTIFGIIHNMTDYRQTMRSLEKRTLLFVVLGSVGLAVQLGIIVLLIYIGIHRKRAEAALRISEQRYDDLARQSRTMVWEVDNQGLYTFVSDVAKDLLGYDPQEMIGQMHFYDLHPTAGREEFKQSSFAVFEQRENFRGFENTVMTRNGRTLWVSTVGTPLLGKTGELLGYRGSDRDITEGKQMRVTLQEKNEEMEQFVYSVSHDLKSPLITIQSFLGILQKNIAADRPEQIERNIATIRSAAGKTNQLLDALLQLSRAGRMESPPSTQPFKVLVDQVVDALAGTIIDHKVNIVVSDVQLKLHGDQLQLGRIWQNLVENAVKYMGDQPLPQIDIGVEESDRAVVFFVRDNGMGIDPKYSNKVFNLFTQLNPESPGSGLGLALVKKLVARYGGTVRVESEGQNTGSCFRFTLPEALVDTGGK